MTTQKKVTTTARRPGKIKVEVIQAHETDMPGGGFKRYQAGDKIEISEKDFSENLHKKII